MSVISSGSSVSQGQVLGASTPAAVGLAMPTVLGATSGPLVAGAAILPITGGNPLVMVLVITSMAVALLVLVSFVVSRLIRKFI